MKSVTRAIPDNIELAIRNKAYGKCMYKTISGLDASTLALVKPEAVWQETFRSYFNNIWEVTFSAQ